MLVLTVSADVISGLPIEVNEVEGEGLETTNADDEDNKVVEELVMERQTAVDEGKQMHVRHISNVIMMFVFGRQVREAFTSYTSLPRH
jgi:hypothetical protein